MQAPVGRGRWQMEAGSADVTRVQVVWMLVQHTEPVAGEQTHSAKRCLSSIIDVEQVSSLCQTEPFSDPAAASNKGTYN